MQLLGQLQEFTFLYFADIPVYMLDCDGDDLTGHPFFGFVKSCISHQIMRHMMPPPHILVVS